VPKYQPIIPDQIIITVSGTAFSYHIAAKSQPVMIKIRMDLIDPFGKNSGSFFNILIFLKFRARKFNL